MCKIEINIFLFINKKTSAKEKVKNIINLVIKPTELYSEHARESNKTLDKLIVYFQK